MPSTGVRRDLALERNVVVMGLTSMVATFGNTLWYFFLPYYYVSEGATTTEIGIIYAAWLAVQALGSGPAGALSDKVGRKNVTVLSSVISMIAVFILAFSNSLLISAVAFPLVGLGTAFFQASKTLLAESVEKERRGTAFGMYFTLEQGLAVISPFLGGYVVSKSGYFPLFFVGAVLTLSAILPRYLLLQETLHNSDETRHVDSSSSGFLSRLKTFAGNRYLLVLVFVYSLYNLFVDQNSYITPLYALDALHINIESAGVLFSAILGVIALARLPAGKLADRIGRKKTVIVSWIGEISVVYIFVFAPVGSLSIALLGIIFWQFFGVMDAPAINAWVAETSDPANRGLSMGMFYSIAYLATVPALVLSGVLFGIEPRLPFYLNTILGVVALILLARYLKNV